MSSSSGGRISPAERLSVPKAKEKPAAVIGRPTDYRPEYCGQLIEHMREGFSFETFGALCGTSKTTLHSWTREFSEFLAAKNAGELLSQLWWEKTGRIGMMGKAPGFMPAVWIFNMKNRFGWQDKISIETELPQYSDAQLFEAAKRANEILGLPPLQLSTDAQTGTQH